MRLQYSRHYAGVWTRSDREISAKREDLYAKNPIKDTTIAAMAPITIETYP